MAGNYKSVYVTLSASAHSEGEREANDYYATDPQALESFLSLWGGRLSPDIWECACGAGHLAKVLVRHGYNVTATDLVDRGYGTAGVDFLRCTEKFDGDIVTNPPYKFAQEFVEKALDLVGEGNRVIMFLKLQFLEGQRRQMLFERKDLEYVYVFSKRVICAKNAEFEKISSSAVAYAWFVFRKGYGKEPVIRWI